MRHPAKPTDEDINKIFTATSAEDAAAFKFAPNATYTKICNDVYGSQKAAVGSGSACLDQKKLPLLVDALRMYPRRKRREFALIFSISNTIADGGTYYEVLQVLAPACRVWNMTAERLQSFSEAMSDKCGRKEIEWAETTATACLCTCPMRPAMLGCGKRACCVAFDLDPKRGTAAKEAAVTNQGEVQNM